VGFVILSTVLDLPSCFSWDLEVFKISPWKITSFSTGKSDGRVAAVSRLVILGHFLQSRCHVSVFKDLVC